MKKITNVVLFMLTFVGYAQVNTYEFAQTTGSYTEIGGTSLGANNTSLKVFADPNQSPLLGGTSSTGPGFLIGFDFIFNGVVYDRFAVNSSGWISLGAKNLGSVDMGTSAYNNYAPLSSVAAISQESLEARISAMGAYILAQAGTAGPPATPDASIQTDLITSGSDQIRVIQWKNYRPQAINPASLNFQIRLHQQGNWVEIVYGNCTSSNYAAGLKPQIGLRVAPSATLTMSNFTNRSSATGDWANTVPGTLANDHVLMTQSGNVPSNGLTFKWSPPACSVAAGFVASNINTSGATISWNHFSPAGLSATAPASGYEYIVSTTNTLPLSTVTGTPTTSTTATISGKNPNTTYYVYFRSNNGDSQNPIYTQWAGLGSFKTLCLDATAFEEHFDTYAINTLPDCWTNIVTGTGIARIASASVAPATPPNRLNMTGNAVGAGSYVIMPPVSNFQGNLQDIQSRLRFKAYCTSTSVQRRIDVGYFDPTNNNTYVNLQTFTNLPTVAASAVELICQPNLLTAAAIPAGVKNLVFRNAPTATDGFNGVYIDDVYWEPIPSCADVTGLTAGITNVNSVSLSWTNDASSGDAQYVYSSSATADPDTLAAVDVAGNSASLTGLSAGTTYKAWVRSKCVNTGKFGTWVSVSFTVPCAPVNYFAENFDAGTNLPACWNKLVATGTVTVFSPPGSITKNQLTLNSSTANDIAIACLPAVTNYGSGTHRLRFRCNVFNPLSQIVIGTLDVGYLVNANDPNSFVQLTQVLSGPADVYTDINIDMSALSSQPASPFLAFRIAAGQGIGLSARIDNVVWEPKPACPDVKNIAINAVNNNSVIISWASLGAGKSYQYAVENSNTAAPGTWTTINTNSVTVDKLNSASDYKFWVRSVCNETEYGATPWPIAFTTTCDPVDSFTENFDAASSLPTCWSNAGILGQSSITSVGTAPSLPNMLTLTAGGAKSAFATVRPVTPAALGTKRLKFKYKCNIADAVLEVGVIKNYADAGTFQALKSFTLGNTGSGIAEITVDDMEITAPGQVLAFRNTGVVASTIYIDDVVWETVPTCGEIVNLINLGVTNKTLDLTWTQGTETYWQYVVGAASVTDPSTLTPVDVDSSAITVGNLTGGTNYKIWVRSKCSGPVYGAWSIPLIFKTSCDPVVSFYENFDSSSNIPNCWAKSGNGGTVQVSTVNESSTLPNALFLYSASDLSAATVALPPVDNFQGYNRLRFKMKSTSVNANLLVGYITDMTDPTTFVALKTFNSANLGVFEQFIAVVNTAQSGILAFRNEGNVSSTIYIDDVSWEPNPACADVQNIVVSSVSANEAAFSWSAGSGSNNFQYALGSSTDSDPNTLEVKNLSTNALNLTQLTSSNFYRLWLRSKCTASSGVWIGPITFATTCNTVESIDEKFDANTTLSACWNKVGSLGGVYVSPVSDAPSGANALVIYSESGFNKGVVAMPSLSNANSGTHRLKFMAKASISNSVLEVGYMVNTADANSFVSLKTVEVAAGIFTSYFVELKNLPQSQTLAFRNAGIENSSIYLDNVVWQAVPTCFEADKPGVVWTKSSTAGFKLDSAATGNWQYVVGDVAATNPADFTAVDSSNSTVTLSKLSPATVYKVWVRSKCGDQNFSDWAGPIVFSTTCLPVASFTEDFNMSDSLPNCWSKAGNTGEVSVNSNPLYANGARSLKIFSGSTTNQGVVAMPAVSGLQTLKFKAMTDAANPVMLELGYLTDINNSNSFVSLQNITVSTPKTDISYKDFEFEISPVPMSEVLAFRNSGSISCNIFIDNVVWTNNLGVDSATEGDFTFYPNPVKDLLNLSNVYGQNFTAVSVFNIIGQEVITKAVNANQTAVDMSDLPHGTYLVKVTSENQVKNIKVIKE